MTRARLPDRRPSCTTQLVYEANIYSVTLGFDVANGRIGEVFTHGAKVGSGMDRLLDDAFVALSLLLQHGVEPSSLSASMGRLGDGKSPASIIGALADLIARRRSHEMGHWWRTPLGRADQARWLARAEHPGRQYG